jgi:MYXO-CTERM domain-containing protein
MVANDSGRELNMAFLRGPTWAFLGTVALAISAFGGCSGDAPRESVGASREEALLGGCSKHKDCEDGNPCTQNLCVAGACLPALPVLGCCFNGDCFGSAGSGGSSGSGSGGTIALGGAVSIGGTVSIGGALSTGGTVGLDCSVHDDCEDNDACTQNLCVVGACVTLPVLGCVLGGEGGTGGDNAAPLLCSDDDQCEDGHPCTENLCVAGLCVPLPVLGCCFNGECTGSGGAGGEGGGGGTISVGGAISVGGVGGVLSVGGIGGTLSGIAGSNSAGSTSQAGAGDLGGSAGSDTGPSDAGAGNDSGGSSHTGATGAGSSAATGNANAAGADANDKERASNTEWVMEGGSCSVSTPRSQSTAPLGLLLVGVGIVAARRRRRLSALALAAAPLVASTSAAAAGFAQDGYTAPAAPEDLMWSERADARTGHLRPFGRLALGYADDPLVLVDANDSSREIRVVDDQFALYGALGFGFFRRAHVALLMPVYVQSSAVPQGAGAIEGARPGDLGVDARLMLLNRDAPLELALAGTLRLPTGDRASFASDGRVTFFPRVLVSKQLTANGTLLNLGVGPVLRPSTSEPGVKLGSQLRLSAGALVALSKVVGVTAEAATSTTTDEPFDKSGTPLEGSLGGRLSFSSVILGTSLSTGLTRGVGSPDLRWLVMLAAPGGAEEAAPERAAAPQDDDTDHDGIHGASDACPSQAEDLDGFDDSDGCPEADNDKDGVPDARDKCPAEAEDLDGFEDDDGCPEADNDKDGIADQDDKCPLQAEDVDQWQDQDGCPEADNDEDGVADAQDKCPNEPETKNGVDDVDGCPDLLRIEEGQIRTLEPIYFDNNKSTIQARSEPLIKEMANLIRTRPDLGVIAIEGYTDGRGAKGHNLKLSRERAAAVRSLLIKSGVTEDRLTSDGFGSERPLDDNKTEAGRAKNRRVEFHFGASSAR